MFCPKCGTPIPEGGRFCGSCGAPAQQNTPATPKKPPRGKKPLALKKLLIPVLCLVLAAGAVFAATAIFGQKTMYLVSRQITDNATLKQTVKTEYDEQGRKASVKNTSKYHAMSQYDSTFQQEYTYDDDGRLISVEIRIDGESRELEYHYDKNGNLKSIECGDREAEVECDKDGRITEISWEEGSAEYSYFKSGAVKEVEIDYGTASYSYVYDEDGHLLEQTNYVMGEKQTVTESAYNKDGKLSSQSIRSYADGKLISDITTAHIYDKSGLPSEIHLTISMDGNDGTLYLKAEDDDLLREFFVVDAELDKGLLEDAGVDDTEEFLEMVEENLDGEPMMVMEFDEHGNTLLSKTMAGNTETTYEYVAVKVPRGYRKAGAQDPLYFIPPIYT